MKFYDRKEELRELRRVQKQAFEEHSRMTVLTGRRRIGKTSLGRMVMEGTPSVYFFVSRKDEALLCQDFMEQIRQNLGDVPTGLKTFKEVFKLLMIFGQNKKFTLFIDEFQEFWQINNSIFSDIQNLWDQYRRQTNIHLILSGSVYTMMEKIFKDSKEPLFGRADLEIRLKPFRTDVMKEIMRDANPEYTNDDLLALYAITGGVPKYIELFINNGCTNLDSMIGFMTRPDSQFIEEGRNLLIQEFGKNYGTYFSILSLIACGEMTQKDIQAKMEDGKNIGGQLRILEEDYLLITKKRPIKAKEGSQTVKFELKDNFLRFWFRYFEKYRQLIEIGNFKMLGMLIRKDFNVYSGFALERWFREKMMESQEYINIGGWWQSDTENPNEIDIVTIDLNDNVHAYEVKRQSKKYNPCLLQQKVEVMRNKIFKGKEIKYSYLSLADM